MTWNRAEDLLTAILQADYVLRAEDVDTMRTADQPLGSILCKLSSLGLGYFAVKVLVSR